MLRIFSHTTIVAKKSHGPPAVRWKTQVSYFPAGPAASLALQKQRVELRLLLEIYFLAKSIFDWNKGRKKVAGRNWLCGEREIRNKRRIKKKRGNRRMFDETRVNVYAVEKFLCEK